MVPRLGCKTCEYVAEDLDDNTIPYGVKCTACFDNPDAYVTAMDGTSTYIFPDYMVGTANTVTMSAKFELNDAMNKDTA